MLAFKNLKKGVQNIKEKTRGITSGRRSCMLAL